LKRIPVMRKRRLLLAIGASVATVAFTVATAMADPVPAPPPYPPVVGVGAQTTQELFNTLCNTTIKDASNNRICQSWNVEPQPSNITTRDPATLPACTIARPSQGGAGTTALINSPTCVDFARVVTNDSATRPAGFTYIPMAQDALTYAISGDSSVPANLTDAVLKRIYQCDATLTFPSNPNGFKPLLGVFGAGNRTFFLQKLGLTDSANYTTLNPCVKDTDASGNGLLANDGRVLTDPKQLITYSSGPWLAQVFKAAPDIHGTSILGSINSISPAILNDSSFMSRPVYNVVRTADTAAGAIHDLFVGPTSRVCSNGAAIKRAGFNTRADCGDTTIQSN
jgi:hypothetical protein